LILETQPKNFEHS